MNVADYRPAPELLRDRVILVTGAGAGIGRALAVEAGKLGAQVILLGRTTAKLESVYDEIERDKGRAAIMPLDLMRATVDTYSELADTVEKEFGRLDGLAHIAGILGDLAPIEFYPPMSWHNVLHINLSAPFLLTRALLPLIKKAPDPSIVFATSSVGRQGRALWGAYAVSKFGIEGLMQVLADEAQDGVPRVNCVNPGATRTAMRRSARPGEDPSTLPSPDEVIAPFLFFLGPDGRGRNGESVDAQPK